MIKKGLPIQEEFLHFLWRMKRFSLTNLQTTEGVEVHLYNLGGYNLDGGPDFIEAKVRIGSTVWLGHIEMHVMASDWLLHGHQHDGAYDNVILHVVYEEDQPIFRKNGERIPCIELKNRFDNALLGKYRRLMSNTFSSPCTPVLNKVSLIVKTSWLERMLVERLETKATDIAQCLEENNRDWEETFYQRFAGNMGLKLNTPAFEMLARSLPQRILSKHRNSLFQLESLLFGQAGFLEERQLDEYPNRMKKEYDFLRKKYNLTPLKKSVWKFLRLRPRNFPTIRIAQLAALIYQSNRLFSQTLDAKNIKDIEQFFSVSVSDYWETHYTFNKPAKASRKTLGKKTIHLLLINTVIPFLYLYGKKRDEKIYLNRAMEWLENLPAENNKVIRAWRSIGVDSGTAHQTQALLQLNNEYCSAKKCLQCAIGCAILR